MSETENTFLKDFPERLETGELLKLLASNYDISSSKDETSAKRRTVLQTLQKRWFYSDLRVRDLYNTIYNVLYQSYDNRDEREFVKIIGFTREWYDSKASYYRPMSNDYNVKGCSVIGVSGVGKTHTVKRILRKCFNQLIDRGNTTQLTYVITNCQDIGSLKQMVGRFVSEVDRLLGTNHSKKLNAKTGKDTVESIAANICAQHYVGVWVVDEIHHLKQVPFQSAQQIINFLKNLSAVVGVPIIFIGTSEAYPILAGNFQVARRAEGNGSVFLDVYQNDKEWMSLMNALWKRRILRTDQPLTKELSDAYYKASQGIIDRLLAVHIKCQEMALDENIEEITVDMIERSRKYFEFTRKGIDALASKRKESLIEFPDLSMRGVNVINQVNAKEGLSEKDLVRMVMEGGFNEEEIKAIFKSIIDQKDSDKKPASEKTSGGKTQSQKRESNAKPIGDIVCATASVEKDDDLHGALKEQGLIPA